MTRKPRILVVADTPGWAWETKALAYATYLQEAFDISICYASQGTPPFRDFDLVHLFEVSQLRLVPETGQTPWALGRPYKLVAGLTAHVWETWGEARMETWAGMVDALHGNSRLLEAELKQFHPLVFYTPNGVDPVRFQRTVPLPPVVTFGHVGKPNPRKGGGLIIEAAREAGVPLKLVQRTAKVALSQAAMHEWYQGITVMVCASNMDGTPNPMLEGAATGCALLSTRIGNMPEFITDRVNGYLLESRLPRRTPSGVPGGGGDPERVFLESESLWTELATRMQELAASPHWTAALGLNARKTVLAGWTWPEQVRYVKTMWESVLG